MSDVKIRAPKGAAETLNIAGVIYTGKKGVFSVPEEAVEHLVRHHGFRVEADDDKQGDA